MTPLERRASLSLALIFALRMLGLFLVLPVFALEAKHFAGGGDPVMVGLAMGIYGLTQGFLQLPLGMASDRFGRKRVIVIGLLVFAAGSLLAACATSIWGLMAGRCLQGAGAVSAAVTALLADQTRDAVRTKAMALVGISIGLMFALSLAVAPLLASVIGLSGLFGLTCALALLGVGVVIWGVPPESMAHKNLPRGKLSEVLSHAGLLRLNLGVFVLHAVQLAMWMAVPFMLEQAGLLRADHWQIYLPAVLGSFILMGGMLFRLERKGYLRAMFLIAIGLIALVEMGLFFAGSSDPSVLRLGLLLFVFFFGFNVLEASQPSLVSKMAPAHVRGTAMGVYNTAQSLGFFVGGAAGGWLVRSTGVQGLFMACTAAMLVWLAVAWPMQVPGHSGVGQP